MGVQGNTMWPRRQRGTFHFVVRVVLIVESTTAFDVTRVLARWR